MKYHAKAALTVTQRTQVRQLSADGRTQASLARQFGVHRRTIQRWVARDEPTDRPSGPRCHKGQGGRVVTDGYREAVIAERKAHPEHGPKRIADTLRRDYPTANSATVWRILHAAGLSQRAPKKSVSAAPSP